MHHLNQLSTLIMIVSMVFTSLAPAKSSNDVNSEIADVLLVIDMVPRAQGSVPNMESASKEMAKWVQKLWEEKHLGNSIKSKKMRVAIVTAGPNENITVVIPLSKGTDPETLKKATFEVYTFNPNTQPVNRNNPMNLYNKINIDWKVFGQESDGDRPFAPDIRIYLGHYPLGDANLWFADIKRQSVAGHYTGSYDVVMITSDWIYSTHGSAIFALGTASMKTGEGPTFELQDEFANGHAKLVEAIKIMLAKCESVKNESSNCYFINKHVCVRNISHAIPEKVAAAPGIRKYCLNGTTTDSCNKSLCTATCAEMDLWTPCSCNTKTQNWTGTSTDAIFKYCPAITRKKQRPCTPGTCEPTTTEVDADAYQLAMPVWALCVCVFCVVVILDVALTLCVYYGCFPDPKNPEASASRSRFQRFDTTMRSFMPSIHSRYGAGGGGRSVADQSRGGGRSMAPSQMPPYTDVSRTRR